ncbi:hypothetical protein HMPREF1047_0608 [Streptococcus oralis SK1074]|uniref:DUF7601 domain-containing protein n=1 Tax=Streptococcus oralis TaxID=1303 RepID=UPI00025AA804|nr:FctA domain-containing protein [Streptococcus oralis]EID26229.1 hypothetical protein HMPREF1047_0608 [Streptococcus oralis SK1074]
MIIMKKENKKTKGIIMKKTFFKKLFTASIAAITALSVFHAPISFADSNDDVAATATGTGETNAKVAINKTLKIAEGITTPEATFTFTFTPQTGTSSNEAPYETGVDIPKRTVTYGSSDELKAGADSIKKATGDIFDGVTYGHAGEYVYSVKEENTGWKPINKDGKDIDSMTYDTRTYNMHVIVKNKKNGNGTYISSVYFRETNNASGAKVKPSTNSGTYTYDLFDNIYRKDAGKITPNEPTPNKPNPDNLDPTTNSLFIKKVVSGDTADKTKDFTFKITFTKSSTATSDTFIGKVNNTEYTFTSGQEKTITLHHDQMLVFQTIPAGTRYTVKEIGTAGYTASATYNENGITKEATGTKATDFSVDNSLIGEKTNNNTITNTLPDVTPTGLLIDNLPFILMIGLGLAGFVVLSKKRREA